MLYGISECQIVAPPRHSRPSPAKANQPAIAQPCTFHFPSPLPRVGSREILSRDSHGWPPMAQNPPAWPDYVEIDPRNRGSSSTIRLGKHRDDSLVDLPTFRLSRNRDRSNELCERQRSFNGLCCKFSRDSTERKNALWRWKQP